MARIPDPIDDTKDEDRLESMPILGVLDTLCSDRGCNGDCGSEFDLRRALRADSFTSSWDDCRCRTGVGILMGALSAFSVALITSVANIPFSLDDNCTSFFPPFRLVGAVFPALTPFDSVEDPFTNPLFAPDFEIDNFVVASSVAVGSNKALRRVTVVAVHVDVEITATRTASALSQ